MILDHSTEEYQTENLFNLNLDKKLKLIAESAASMGSPQVNFIPLKASSLVDPMVLEEITKILSEGKAVIDKDSILSQLSLDLKLHFDNGLLRLRTICESARAERICLLLDAEESIRQPGLEFIFRELAVIFNHRSNNYPPVIYNTYQAYLLRTEAVIDRDIQHANDNNYIFAFKLVRGAYFNSEIRRALQAGVESPLQKSKSETDAAYNRIILKSLKLISSTESNFPLKNEGEIRILIATHNKESVVTALQAMKKFNLPNNHPHVSFAQILGMTDNITYSLGLANYNVSKLILFGDFEDILPWLLRRLDENNVNFNIIFDHTVSIT